MISAPTPCSSNLGSKVEEKFSNKRKFIQNFPVQEAGIKKFKSPPSMHSGSQDRTGLQLETPLPLNWPQCLDIQSGTIIYSGSTERSRARTSNVKLDLELNLLPCDSSERKPNRLLTDLNDSYSDSSDLLFNIGIKKEESKQEKKNHISSLTTKLSSTSSAPAWLAFEGDEKSEMVATVCKRCFMLVMLCKASPACPNCKFMHTPDQSAPFVFKRRLTQLLY